MSTSPRAFGLRALIYRPSRPGNPDPRPGGIFREFSTVTIVGAIGPHPRDSSCPAEDDPHLCRAHELSPAVYVQFTHKGTVWAVPAERLPNHAWENGGTFIYCDHPWFLGIVGRNTAIHLHDRISE